MRRHHAILTILVVAAAARVPFLWHGFGAHPDEWAVIRSGLDVWQTGQYYISRLPGYPLNEIMMGGLAWVGGAPLCALSSTLASLIGLAFVYRLAERYGVADPRWLTVALSFHPWFWSSGTHGLDYAWSLCCQIVAWHCVECGKPGRGGVWAGMGFGFRPTSIGWMGALGLLVVLRSRRRRPAARFAVTAALISAGFAALIGSRPECWASAGRAAASNAELINPANLTLGVYRTVEFFGHLPGVAALAAAFLVALRARPNNERLGEGRLVPHFLVVAGYLSFFLVNSGKAEYLLPTLPSLLLVLGRRVTPGWWKLITVAFLINGLVSIDLGRADKGGLTLETPHLRRGAVLWYAQRCRHQNEALMRLAPALDAPGSVISPFRDFFLLNAVDVSARLPRGPAGQARLGGPLMPFRLHTTENGVESLRPWPGLVKPQAGSVVGLARCDTGGGVVFPGGVAPAAGWVALIEGYCQSRGAPRPKKTRSRPPTSR